MCWPWPASAGGIRDLNRHGDPDTHGLHYPDGHGRFCACKLAREEIDVAQWRLGATAGTCSDDLGTAGTRSTDNWPSERKSWL